MNVQKSCPCLSRPPAGQPGSAGRPACRHVAPDTRASCVCVCRHIASHSSLRCIRSPADLASYGLVFARSSHQCRRARPAGRPATCLAVIVIGGHAFVPRYRGSSQSSVRQVCQLCRGRRQVHKSHSASTLDHGRQQLRSPSASAEDEVTHGRCCSITLG